MRMPPWLCGAPKVQQQVRQGRYVSTEMPAQLVIQAVRVKLRAEVQRRATREMR